MQQPSPDVSLDQMAVQGIKCVRQLRRSVGAVFGHLESGIVQSEDAEISDEKFFAKKLKDQLQVILEDYDKIDKLCLLLQKNPVPLLSSTAQLLNQNAICSMEDPASEEVFGMYNWLNKVNDYSNLGSVFLSSHTKKNQTKLFRRPQAQFHNATPQFVQGLVNQLDKYIPGMELKLVKHGRNTHVLLITLGQVLRVAVVLRGLLLEWANVKAFGESFTDLDGKLDIRSKSRLILFQKITNQVRGALLYLSSSYLQTQPLPPQVLLRQFITWVHMYKNLFNEKCVKCKKILKDFTPPLCRDYRSGAAHHEHCKV